MALNWAPWISWVIRDNPFRTVVEMVFLGYGKNVRMRGVESFLVEKILGGGVSFSFFKLRVWMPWML